MKISTTVFRTAFTSVLVLAAAFSAWAQNAGNVDPAFDPGAGPSYPVYSMAVQSDGKVIIGGGFYFVDTYTVNSFARLNADGTLDFTFTPGDGANGRILAMALQADGKVIVVGDFTEINGYTRNGVARLNTDGSVDVNFGFYAGANNVVHTVAIQPDGQILVGGDFTTFNNNPFSGIARLNGTDGSLDFDFDPGDGATSSVYTIALQPGGDIIVGGNFLYFDDYYTPGIVRLDTYGYEDTTFGVSGPPTTNNYVAALYVLPGGKIIVGGGFTEIGGYQLNAVARLNANGTLDTTFYDPAGGPNGPVLALGVQPDGDVIIGGDFTGIDNIDGGSIGRLLPSGILDLTYGPGYPANGAVNTLKVLPNGEAVAAGAFTSIGGITRDFIARLYNGATANPTNVRYLRLLSLNGLDFGENSTLTLAAEADSPGDPVTSVTLYNNGAMVAHNSLTAAEIAAANAHDKARKEGKVRQDSSFGQGFSNFTTLVTAGLNNITVTGTTQSGATITSNTSAVTGKSASATATCQITNPASGALPAGGVPVQVSVTKSAQTVTVDFYVDSAKSGASQVQTGNVTASSFVLPSLSTDRPHTLSAVVTDNSTGFSSQSPQVVLTPAVVVAAVPIVSIVVPSANGGNAVTISDKGPPVKLHITRAAADGNAADLDVSQPLTVTYKTKGSAQAGVNYKVLSGSVTIPAGATSVKLKVKPIDDGGQGGLTVLKIKILPSTDGSYNTGDVTLAKVKISEDE